MAHIIVIGSYRRTMSLPIPSVLFLECTLALVSLNVHGTSYLWSRNERSPSPLLRKQETPPPLARVQSCCVAGCARIGMDDLGAACPMNTAESLRAFRYPVQRPGREGEAIWDASGSSLPPGKGNRGCEVSPDHITRTVRHPGLEEGGMVACLREALYMAADPKTTPLGLTPESSRPAKRVQLERIVRPPHDHAEGSLCSCASISGATLLNPFG